LDEGDRMLDMGFADEILAIVGHTPRARQTLLFSATYPPEIERMSATIQRDALRIDVDEAHAAPHIEQIFHEVEPALVTDAVVALLAHHRPPSTLVFCATKVQCAALARALHERGGQALAIHGDLEQPERDRALTLFANGSCPVLVATDVAARGLDIDELAAVINVELPREPEVYVHRIGRTGRAGASGLAISLFAPSELPRLRAIEALQHTSARVLPLPAAGGTLPVAPRITLSIRAGRRDKLRAGDVLGALTNDGGIASAHVGKIAVGDRLTYVAIDRAHADAALRHLQRIPIKGRRLPVQRVE
ncbi:MAG TPA: helicase-related protein, partial [Nannocystaceae bacterium]|nr:helicase-related protein [Nannocystaceae bacterium]